MDQGLVLAGLSALTGNCSTVMTYDDYQNCNIRPNYHRSGELNMSSLFEMYHATVNEPKHKTGGVKSGQGICIYITTPTGKMMTVYLDADCTATELIDRLAELTDHPSDGFFLILNGKQLEPDKKLSDYKAINETTIHMVLRLRGGSMNAYFTNDLDPRWDYDFTNIKDGSKKFMRGGLKYKRPCGWKRFAIKVRDKYDNNNWLGYDGNDKEWPVSYHGTNLSNAVQIVEDKYDVTKQKQALYGNGIYSTPDVEYASMYSTSFEDSDGEMYKIVLQNRVDPSAMKTYADGKIFLVPNGQHIRPYGVLIRKE